MVALSHILSLEQPWTTEAIFQEVGNLPESIDFEISLDKIGETCGDSFLNTITGIPSGPLDLEASRHLIICLTRFTEIEGVGTVSCVR